MRRISLRDEGGQVLLLTAVTMSMLLVVVGLVVDVGHAMLVQRQLQAGVDAAALAGAQELPDRAQTMTTAHNYSPTPGSKNAVNTIDNAVTTVEVLCLSGVPGCNRRDGGVNGLKVHAKSDVPTWFGRIIGIDKMTVSARSTACSPCTVKPLDIMLVLDRTGSMCRTGSGGYERPVCPDLKNARDGMEYFLTFLDPSTDKVGLALTPPVLDRDWRSSCPSPNGYLPWNTTPNPNVPSGHPARNFNGKFYGLDAYWPDVMLWGPDPAWPTWVVDPQGSTPSVYTVAHLEGADGIPADDYLTVDQFGNYTLNTGSTLVQRLRCAGAEGSTAYALAIEEAQRELDRNGRGNVQDIIIFLGDGAANSTHDNVPTNHWTNNGRLPTSWFNRPCGSAVESARRLKTRAPTPTIIYTIGYDLNGLGTDHERCLRPDAAGHQQASNPGNYEIAQSWGSTAYDAIRAMASDPDGPGGAPPLFWNKPDPGDLTDIFGDIATDIVDNRARLIDNDNPNLLG
jgi:hypothetical protein